jgi:DNA-binding NtrC family response regulator
VNRPDSRPPRILVTDDEEDVRWMIVTLLRRHGLEPVEAEGGRAALKRVAREPLDAMLLDVRMPGCDGMEVLQEVRKLDPGLPVILVTAHGTITSAVEAVKMGAYDYVTKPFDNDDLVLKLCRAVETRRLKRENDNLRSQVGGDLSLRETMGPSEPIRKLLADVERVAPTDFTVVVTGETGTGKELIAKAVHRLSHRSAGPFVPVDCGSIPPTLIESELFGHEKGAFTGADQSRPGSFEAAAGGTLFLDELGNLPLLMQAKLLRALQERQVCRVGSKKPILLDVRVVAATNEDLADMVAAGKFRRDLYHRLHEFSITLPPLRERAEDVLHLAKQFLEQTRAELRKEPLTLDRQAEEMLLRYPWPGNVRQLRNVVRRAVLLAEGGVIGPAHLDALGMVGAPAPGTAGPERDAEITESVSFKALVRQSVAETERRILLQVLRQTGGNKAKAARLLQIDYKTIRSKAREYGISVENEEEDRERGPS